MATSGNSAAGVDREPPAKIMVIRHAEKPLGSQAPYGVTADGVQSGRSLTVRGWQRAGALVGFFYTPTDSRIQRPDYLYAPAQNSVQEDTDRPLETLSPLAARLGLSPDTGIQVGAEAQLVSDVMTRSGLSVLIAWEHKHIPAIGNLILQNQSAVPQVWPPDRFDLVWIFDLQPAPGGYAFSQVPQLLLGGDEAEPIAL